MPTRVHTPGNPRLPRELIERWGRARLVGNAGTARCEGTDCGAVHHAIAETGGA